MADYYFQNGDGETDGPIPGDDLRALLADGMLSKDALVSKAGGPWKEAREYSELSPIRNIGQPVHPALLAAAKPKDSSNPPYFGFFVFMSLLLWPIGLLASIAYLTNPNHRGAGAALLGISFASAAIAWAIFLR